MNIVITIGFVAGVALVIYGVQWLVSAGVSKAQDVGEGMLYRHQVNKEGGQQLTAEDMRKANRVVKAFEKGIISECRRRTSRGGRVSSPATFSYGRDFRLDDEQCRMPADGFAGPPAQRDDRPAEDLRWPGADASAPGSRVHRTSDVKGASRPEVCALRLGESRPGEQPSRNARYRAGTADPRHPRNRQPDGHLSP